MYLPVNAAKEILPAEKGDAYSYLVDKYWIVKSIDDNALTLVTRRGKENIVPLDDPRLRLPNWWELLFHRGRFPQLDVSS